MYFCSLASDEGRSIRFDIAYVDPKNPDPHPPLTIRRDRWIYTPLRSPVPFLVADAVKLALASDPRTSALAVYPNNSGALYVWGLIDQGNQYYDALNFEASGTYPRPGLFQASIHGPAWITAELNTRRIAELRRNRLSTSLLNIFDRGVVIDTLKPAIDAYRNRIRNLVSPSVYGKRHSFHDSWDEELEQCCLERGAGGFTSAGVAA
jgi:hypothetical protein